MGTELAKAYVQIIPTAEGIQGKLSSLMGSEAESAGKSAGGKFSSFFGSAAKAGLAAVGAASGAMAAFATDAVKVGMGFDSSMSQVAATMGVAVEDIQELRDFAQEMGATTAFSASQAADALNFMALAGYDAATSMDMLPNVLNLAAAGGIELAYASDMVTDASSALGLSIDETAELVDKMAKASSKSNTSVAQLGEAILTVGGTAKNLSGGTTELAQVLGILADNGIKASEGGTHLRNIMLAMNPTTDDAVWGFNQLKLSAYDAEGSLRPLEDIFLEMNEAMVDMSDQEKQDILSAIFNKTDLSSVNALLSTTQMRWHELTADIESASYSMDDMRAAVDLSSIAWEKYADTSWGAKNLAAEMFDEIAWNLKNNRLSIEELQDYLQGEYNLDFEDAVTAIEDVQNALENATGAAQAMANTQLDNLTGDITIFQSALEAAKIAVSDKLTPSLREFVQFGTEGLGKITEGFLNGGLSGAMEAFGEVLSDGLDMIVDFLPEMIDAGMALLSALGEGILRNLPKLTEAATEIILKLVGYLLDNLPEIIRSGLEIIVTLANGIVEALPELVPALVDTVMEIVDVLTDPENLGMLVDASIQIIIALANGLVESLPRLIEKAPEIIRNLLEAIIKNTPKLLKAGAEVIVTIVKGIWDNLKDIFNAAGQIVGELLAGWDEWLDSVFSAGVDAITQIWEGLMSLDPIQWGKDLIGNFIGGIKQGWEDLKTGVKNVAQGVKDFLGFSEPKEGPLSDFHTYAPDMMALFAQGIRQNEHLITDQLENSLDFGERVIGLNARVTGALRPAMAESGNRTNSVTVNVYGAEGQSAEALAREVERVITRSIRTKEAAWA